MFRRTYRDKHLWLHGSSWPPEIELGEGAWANTVSGFGKQQEMEAKLRKQEETISDLRAQVEARNGTPTNVSAG